MSQHASATYAVDDGGRAVHEPERDEAVVRLGAVTVVVIRATAPSAASRAAPGEEKSGIQKRQNAFVTSHSVSWDELASIQHPVFERVAPFLFPCQRHW